MGVRLIFQVENSTCDNLKVKIHKSFGEFSEFQSWWSREMDEVQYESCNGKKDIGSNEVHV